MKIPTKTRYGIKLMLHLAINYGGSPLFLNEIAVKENISQKYLSQIVIPLKSAGLISSLRGARGGYLLNKAPVKINLKTIFEALEGNLDFVENSNCRANPKSPVGICLNDLVWQKLEEVIKNTLESITLEDLARSYRTNEKNSIIYNI